MSPARRAGWSGRARAMWSLVAVLGVALVAWVAVQTAGGRDGGGPTPTASASAPSQQQTLLIQVRNDAQSAADNMIAATGGGQPPAQLLVPSRLVVDARGAGQQTLGQTGRLLDRTASQDALSDLLALRIDGTLSLGRLALAGIVDFVGGITLTVDTEVTQADPRTRAVTVLVPSGPQTLDGTQAAAYALAWLPGEPESARLARFSEVMTRTIAALPDDQLRVEQMLTSLGGSARTTTTTTAAAQFLVRMRPAILAGGQQVQLLPTSQADGGTGIQVVRIDLDAADEVVGSLLPDAGLGAEARPRVLVRDGVGQVGLAAEAGDLLVAAGMVFIGGGNAELLGQPRTRVVVTGPGADSAELGLRVARALGVPATAVDVQGAGAASDGAGAAEAVVVLGADFAP